jgi:hypothetical protein
MHVKQTPLEDLKPPARTCAASVSTSQQNAAGKRRGNSRRALLC